jgi:hypothetical protein
VYAPQADQVIVAVPVAPWPLNPTVTTPLVTRVGQLGSTVSGVGVDTVNA